MTNRWGFLVLVALDPGPLRFHLLRDAVEGISEKMLSQTLKLLIRDGLIERRVVPAVPPQVSYALTSLGAGITPRLDSIADWIGQNLDAIGQAQDRYDRDNQSQV